MEIILKDKSCLYLPDKKVDKVLNVYKKELKNLNLMKILNILICV